MISELHFKTILQSEQRYPTVGDYWEAAPGVWEIRVSESGDWRMNCLVLIHELVELVQTENDGINEPDIKAYDEASEKRNTDPDAEPGEQPDAPYHHQHIFAENIERMVAAKLGINWNKYDAALMEIWRQQ